MDAANIEIDGYKTISDYLNKFLNHEICSNVRINIQEKHKLHYLLSWQEAHGLLFEMGFLSRLLLETRERGIFSRLVFYDITIWSKALVLWKQTEAAEKGSNNCYKDN